jgi:pyruvate kinase
MDAIVREVETDWLAGERRAIRDLKLIDIDEWRFPTAAARAAALMSFALPLKAVVTFTQDGHSAALISEHRPRSPIVAITSEPQVASRLALHWGVKPYIEVPPDDLEESLRICTALLVREKLCEKGDAFVMLVAWPTSGRTNTLKLHRL